MGPPTDEGSVRAAVQATVCPDPGVNFVVMFGSHIRGAPRPGSDIDLAVKFADTCAARDRFRKRCFFAGELQRPTGPYVDVSDIEALPLDVAHDAVCGEFLCGDAAAFRAFKTEIEARYETERDTLRQHQRAIIDRIAEDGLRG